jgi:hypothetical protein
MPRLRVVLSTRIRPSVQLGALLVPPLPVTGEANTILMGPSAD